MAIAVPAERRSHVSTRGSVADRGRDCGTGLVPVVNAGANYIRTVSKEQNAASMRRGSLYPRHYARRARLGPCVVVVVDSGPSLVIGLGVCLPLYRGVYSGIRRRLCRLSHQS